MNVLLWLFLTMPWVGLQCVIVVFPEHSDLLFVVILVIQVWICTGSHIWTFFLQMPLINTHAGPNVFIEKYRKYSKPVLSGHWKRRPELVRSGLLLNAGQKYCRMLQGEHSAILSTFIKLPFFMNTFVLCIYEWLLKTGFTVVNLDVPLHCHSQQNSPALESAVMFWKSLK